MKQTITIACISILSLCSAGQVSAQNLLDKAIKQSKTVKPVQKARGVNVQKVGNQKKSTSPTPKINKVASVKSNFDSTNVADTTISLSEFPDSHMLEEVIIQKNPSFQASNPTIPYEVVEQPPTFPGGEAAMYKWLASNIKYPADAAEESIQGRVVVQFIIDEFGRVTDAKVVRGRHPSLDAEALRVVGKMPKWTPGRNYGTFVRVQYTVPVTFKL